MTKPISAITTPPALLFHVTPASKVAAILKEGLLPKIGERSRAAGEMMAAVYLFSSMEAVENACMNWLADAFDEDEQLALLAVNPTDAIAPVPGCEWETVSTAPIPPEALRVLADDLDELDALAYLRSSEQAEPLGMAP